MSSIFKDANGNWTDFAVRNGAPSHMFVVSAEGNVYRRKPATANEYALVGALNNPTEERREAVLQALRNANPDRVYPLITGGTVRKCYANYKQAKEIVKNF